MGAWDHTSFGNDTAGDWGGSLLEYDDLSFVEETLDAVLDSEDEELDGSEAEEAIAAAEIIARLQGRPGVQDAYTEDVDEWVANHQLVVPSDLAKKAHAVLDRILTPPSELLELWEESDSFEAWKNSITELKGRIEIG